MKREEAEKRAKDYTECLFQATQRDWPSYGDQIKAAYLQAFDDMKTNEVPWTEEDIRVEVGSDPHTNPWIIGFLRAIKWAEKRIKERGL